MANLYELAAKVSDDGSKLIYNVPLMKVALKALAGKDITIGLNIKSNKRSNDYNSYYWVAVIPPIQEYFGYNKPEEAHRAMGGLFLYVPQNGIVPGYVRSTADLTNAEFKVYVDTVIRYMADEYGVIIHDPHQIDFL